MTAVHIEHTGTFGRQRKWVLVTSGRKVVAYNIGLPQQEIQIDNGNFARVVGKVQPFTHYVRIGHYHNGNLHKKPVKNGKKCQTYRNNIG